MRSVEPLMSVNDISLWSDCLIVEFSRWMEILHSLVFSFFFGVCVTGGAASCVSIHVGEIKPGGLRGNHRHHTCNETFVLWGAKTRFRVSLRHPCH